MNPELAWNTLMFLISMVLLAYVGWEFYKG